MPLLRTALVLALAVALFSIPAVASADTDAGTTTALAATLGSSGSMRALLTCHGTPACQRTAARGLQAQVRVMASGLLMRDSQYRCDLLAFERTYGPTQNALAAWAARPDALHARVAMTALQAWYAAMGVTQVCAR